MPIYGFLCENCEKEFDIFCYMNEILDIKPICPTCKQENVHRVFNSVYIFDSSPRTVGAQADRNTERMSEDHKHHINAKNKTKKQPFTGKLPKGAYLKPVDHTGKNIASIKKGKNLGKPK